MERMPEMVTFGGVSTWWVAQGPAAGVERRGHGCQRRPAVLDRATSSHPIPPIDAWTFAGVGYSIRRVIS
jgi:hypothetical protein